MFAKIDGFDYAIPSMGVLPYLPSTNPSMDSSTLTAYIESFIAEGPSNWNTFTDTYWSGKAYSKVSELAAIAREPRFWCEDRAAATATATGGRQPLQIRSTYINR